MAPPTDSVLKMVITADRSIRLKVMIILIVLAVGMMLLLAACIAMLVQGEDIVTALLTAAQSLDLSPASSV
ncbi:MAG: hypothetical protein MPJ50_19545 [Pirellulales bacterium]|nr:hypothetical protein [Pirellulales bacterium]